MFSSSRFSRAMHFFKDKDYYKQLLRLMLPIALQNIFASALNLVSVLMIGQLGDAPVAAVGLANQVWFLLNIIVFGVVSGASMFQAQFWGKRDIHNIRRVLGLSVKISAIVALIFWGAAFFFPESVLRIYSSDPAVIEEGSRYLRTVSWSYWFYAITSAYSTAARATGNVRTPMLVSTSALGVGVVLQYVFIFGFPPMGIEPGGVNGAAIGILIARGFECVTFLLIIYLKRSSPIAANLRDLADANLGYFGRVMTPVLPVIINEVLWSFAITTYNVIYGHISTQSVAAINIASTVESLAWGIFLGVGNATSIMVGHLIGESKTDQAYRYAGRSLVVQALGGLGMGALIYLFGGTILQYYKVSPEVVDYARGILTVMAIGWSMRAVNHVIIIGVLRAGGDSRFSLFLDGIIIWLVGVPLVAAAAFLLHLPIYYVYAFTMAEEAVKMIVGLWRYFSKRWINDLTIRISPVSTELET